MIVTVCTGVGRDEEVFADGKVQHIGQIIGIIVAESQPLAQRAAKAVCVTYEDLPSIITIEVCKIITTVSLIISSVVNVHCYRMRFRLVHFTAGLKMVT